MALYHSSLRWFGTCSCKPVPRGLPSSLVQPRGALTRENNGCFEGLIATGVCEVSREIYQEEVKTFMEMSPYQKDLKTAMDFYDNCIETIKVPPCENACLVVGPFHKIEEPDLVLMFCTPRQADVLIRSQSYHGNLVKGFGGNGGCIFNIRHAFYTGEASFSTSDFPWRMFIGLDDHELTVTFPYNRLVQSAPVIKPIVDYVDNLLSMFAAQ